MNEKEKSQKYGVIVARRNGCVIRKIPNLFTARCESDMTRRGKEILMHEYDGLIEECGVYNHNFGIRHTIDLYNPKTGYGIDVYRKGAGTSKVILRRLENYKKFCTKVAVAFLKDSSRRWLNHHYTLIVQRIRLHGYGVMIVDIANGGKVHYP